MKTTEPQFPARLARALVIACTLLPTALFVAADASKPVKVFIFAGQSNMEGADAHPERIDDLPVMKTAHLPHARLHFGTQGTLLLGEEMAQAYLGIR